MTEQNHSITPPPELVEQWAAESEGLETLCNRAVQWGADQELEACCEWLDVPNNRSDRGDGWLMPGRLRAARRPTLTWSSLTKWEVVAVGTRIPWRHTSTWRSPDGATPATTTTIPRKFTSITHSDDRYLALADDGTAWFNYGKCWMQLDPLPAREVEGGNG